MSEVALLKTDDYSDLKDKLSILLSHLGGLSKFVKPGQKVLLKPNLFGRKVSELAITNKDLIRALIEMIKELGAKPLIGELVASDEPGVNKKAFKEVGIIDLAKEMKVKLVDFQTGEFFNIQLKDPLVLKNVQVAKKMLDVDVVINLPKFKGHPCTYITGAVKNSFGCIRPELRPYIHKDYLDDDFSKAVLDVYSVMPFHLHIMDAIVGMEGDEAPAYGEEAKIGYLLASTDGIAIDAVASRMTGHKLNYLPTIKYGHDHGLGIGKLSDMKLLGDKPKTCDFNFHGNYKRLIEEKEVSSQSSEKNAEKDESSAKASERLFPEIKNEDCIKCLACMQNCPVEAIFQKDSELYIDYQKCIQCYRCLEACPNSAIALKEKKF